MYNVCCDLWNTVTLAFILPSKEILKYGHLQQVVPKYRFNWYEMHCEGKLKIRPHNLIWGLIEVVTKVDLTVKSCFNSRMVKTGSTMLL
jgi:hypothetical protein